MSRQRAPLEKASPLHVESSQTEQSSGSSSLLEAHNLAISGGQFNSVQGHHTNLVINLNQGSPTQSPFQNRIAAPSISSHRNTRSPLGGGSGRYENNRSQTSILREGRRPRVPENPASSQPPVQQSNVIYQRHLELKGRGFPLWIPPPNQNLPIQYRRTGVRIGDVGIITPDGGFSFLFNICLPHDDPVNPRILPENFSPIFPPMEATSIDKFQVFGHGSHLASASIEKEGSNSSQFSGFQFESSASEGAILTMPLGATSESLGNIAKFRKYAASNIVHWYKFVNGILGREAKNGDIRLVVGCDKTTSWGIATFANQSHQSSCRLRFGPPAVPSSNSISSNSSRYVWEYSGIADVRAGPSPGENNGLRQDDDPSDVVHENQCLFLRTLNTTLSDDIWSDIHCDSNSVGLQLQSDIHPAKDSASAAPSIKRTSTTMNQPSNLSSHRSGNRRCLDPCPESQVSIAAFDSNSVIFDSGLLSNPLTHPSKALNDILMTKESVPGAHMVITHDEDWSLVASEYDIFPDPHELVEQILVSHCVCEEDGVIFLDRREAVGSGEPVPENLGEEIAEIQARRATGSLTPLGPRNLYAERPTTPMVADFHSATIPIISNPTSGTTSLPLTGSAQPPVPELVTSSSITRRRPPKRKLLLPEEFSQNDHKLNQTFSSTTRQNNPTFKTAAHAPSEFGLVYNSEGVESGDRPGTDCRSTITKLIWSKRTMIPIFDEISGLSFSFLSTPKVAVAGASLSIAAPVIRRLSISRGPQRTENQANEEFSDALKIDDTSVTDDDDAPTFNYDHIGKQVVQRPYIRSSWGKGDATETALSAKEAEKEKDDKEPARSLTTARPLGYPTQTMNTNRTVSATAAELSQRQQIIPIKPRYPIIVEDNASSSTSTLVEKRPSYLTLRSGSNSRSKQGSPTGLTAPPLLDAKWKERDNLEARKAEVSETQRGANVVTSSWNLPHARVDVFGAETDEWNHEETMPREKRRERREKVRDGRTVTPPSIPLPSSQARLTTFLRHYRGFNQFPIPPPRIPLPPRQPSALPAYTSNNNNPLAASAALTIRDTSTAAPLSAAIMQSPPTSAFPSQSFKSLASSTGPDPAQLLSEIETLMNPGLTQRVGLTGVGVDMGAGAVLSGLPPVGTKGSVKTAGRAGGELALDQSQVQVSHFPAADSDLDVGASRTGLIISTFGGSSPGASASLTESFSPILPFNPKGKRVAATRALRAHEGVFGTQIDSQGEEVKAELVQASMGATASAVPASRPTITIGDEPLSVAIPTTETAGSIAPLISLQQYHGWLSAIVSPLEEFIDEGVDPRKHYLDLKEIVEGESSTVFSARLNPLTASKLRLPPLIKAKDAEEMSQHPEQVKWVAMRSVAVLPSVTPKLVDLRKELMLIKGLVGHENVLGVDGVYFDLVEDSLWVRMELMERSLVEMVGLVGDGLVLQDRMLARFTSDVLSALEYLQKHSIAHRDVRSDNLLLNKHGFLKLADYSNAVQVARDFPMRTDPAGVIYWQAPEVRKPPYNALKVDVWSLGATVWEMAQTEPPFYATQQFGDRWPPLRQPELYSPAFHDFLRHCSEPPLSRPSPSDLLKHPFVHSACGRPAIVNLLSRCNAIEQFLNA